MLLLVAAILLLGCTGEAADRRANGDHVDPQTLVLGFIPSQTAEQVVPDAERLAAFLARRIGRDVDVHVPTTYEPLVEGFRFGHVHAAFLDGGAASIAHHRTGAEVILAEVNGGSTFYWAEAFVRADSPMQSLRDVLGKRVAFTSRTGSSGFIMPIGSMIREGLIKPEGETLADLERALQQSFSQTIVAGGYGPALVAVLEGRADVAFGAHDSPQRFLTAEQQARLRPLHRFGRIPSHSVVVSGDLDPRVVDALRDAMLALNEPENLPLLKAIYGVDGLQATSTEEHLGEFADALTAIPGMAETLVPRRQ